MWPRRGSECGMCWPTVDLLGMGGREQPNPSREFELACAWLAHLHSIGWVANGDQ